MPYCSRACQTRDWTLHKLVCRKDLKDVSAPILRLRGLESYICNLFVEYKLLKTSIVGTALFIEGASYYGLKAQVVTCLLHIPDIHVASYRFVSSCLGHLFDPGHLAFNILLDRPNPDGSFLSPTLKDGYTTPELSYPGQVKELNLCERLLNKLNISYDSFWSCIEEFSVRAPSMFEIIGSVGATSCRSRLSHIFTS